MWNLWYSLNESDTEIRHNYGIYTIAVTVFRPFLLRQSDHVKRRLDRGNPCVESLAFSQ